MATWFDDGDPAEQPVEDPPVVIRVPFLYSGGGLSDVHRSGRCGEHGGRLCATHKKSLSLTAPRLGVAVRRQQPCRPAGAGFPRGNMRAPPLPGGRRIQSQSRREVRGSPQLRGEVRVALQPSSAPAMSSSSVCLSFAPGAAHATYATAGDVGSTAIDFRHSVGIPNMFLFFYLLSY